MLGFPELAAQKERLDPPALLALTHASLGVRHHRLLLRRRLRAFALHRILGLPYRCDAPPPPTRARASAAPPRPRSASRRLRPTSGAAHADARSALRVAARRATSSAECALVARARRPSGIARIRRLEASPWRVLWCQLAACPAMVPSLLLPPLSRPARRRRSPLHRVPSPLPRPQPHGKRRRAGSVGRARALAREPPRPRASAQVRHGRRQARRRECAIRRRGVPTPQLQRATAPTRPPGPPLSRLERRRRRHAPRRAQYGRR